MAAENRRATIHIEEEWNKIDVIAKQAGRKNLRTKRAKFLKKKNWETQTKKYKN